MKQGGFFGPSRGQLSAIHDCREMIESKMGVIHVIKDESQILPYCILHLTRDQLDSGAVSPSMAMRGPMQRMPGLSVPVLKPNMPQRRVRVRCRPCSLSLLPFQCLADLPTKNNSIPEAFSDPIHQPAATTIKQQALRPHL